MGAKKNFVLDTNVILHDYKCIENFQENDIYLPIVVLEELDKFKKGSEQINYNAREFVRELDLLTSNDLFLKGASLGPGKGTLYIVTGDKYQEKIAHSFPDKTPDHRILSDYSQSAIDGFSCSMLESIQIRRHLRFYPKHRVDFSGSMLLKSDYFSPHNYPLR